jgi:tetratricopeptide (TPR) repeat protein
LGISDATAAPPPSILNVSPSARSAALGDASAALSDDASAVFSNPAGLAFLNRASLMATHLRHSGDTLCESTAYVMPYPDRCGWGVRVGYIDYGSFERQDGLPGRANVSDITLGASFGFQLSRNFAAGLQTAWTSQSLEDRKKDGLWWDMGFLAKASRRVRLGLALKNIGVAESGGGPPFSFRWGVAFQGFAVDEKKEGLLLSLGSSYEPKGSHRANAGLEFNHQDRFCFRLGYSPDLDAESSDATQGVNLGGGLRVRQFQIDYSLSLEEADNEHHRVSLTYLFPALGPRPACRPEPPGGSNFPTPREPKTARTPVPPTPAPTPGSTGVPPTPTNGDDPKNLVVLPFKVDDTALMTAEECLAKGQALERQGRWRETLRYYLVAIEKKPDLERAWLLLGNLQVRAGIDSYREALRLNPNNEALRKWLEKAPAR